MFPRPVGFRSACVRQLLAPHVRTVPRYATILWRRTCTDAPTTPPDTPSAGSSQDPRGSAEWVGSDRSVGVRLRLAMERQGDAIITCANLLQLSGFACTDALYLQSLLIFGNGAMALFFITRIPLMGVPFGWAMLKVAVNIFMVYKITVDRQPVELTPSELDVYEEHFMPFGITARQFKKFWDLGEEEVFDEPTRLAIEGEPIQRVALVLHGYVHRTIGGKHVRSLDTCPNVHAEHAEGDVGAWIGDISALRMIDTVSDARQEAVSRELYRRKYQKTLGDLGLDGTLPACAYDYDTANHDASPQRKGREASEDAEDEMVASSPGDIVRAARQPPEDPVDRVISSRLSHSLWTVHVSSGVVIRWWDARALITLCRANSEMSGLVRKAFAQSAIKKTIVLDGQRRRETAGGPS